MSTRTYPSQKGKILESAERLILEKGPGSLKTDAIIKASGLSKGGFFYHFKTLEDLLYELGKKSWVDFLELVQKEAEEDPDPIGRFCRSYIKISVFGTSKSKKDIAALNSVFLEVTLSNRKVLERIKRDATEMGNLFEVMAESDGLPPEKVKLIQMAADGVWFNEIIGYLVMKKKEKDAFFDYLVGLTRG